MDPFVGFIILLGAWIIANSAVDIVKEYYAHKRWHCPKCGVRMVKTQ